MASKMKTSKKKAKSKQAEGKNSQGNTTVLGLSPRELGSAVAAAVVAEVSQVAVNKLSQSMAQSNPEKTLQNQLNPINGSIKTIVGGVKEAIADAASPASDALDAVENTVANGRSAVGDRVGRGIDKVKEKTAVTAGIAQDQVEYLLDDAEEGTDQTRDFVVNQIKNAIAGTQDTADRTRNAVDTAIDTTQGTASATQEAVALVINEAVSQVKSILADAGSAAAQRSGKKGKKGKKAKKNKKSK